MKLDWQKEKIDNLIRDITRAGFMPKSEARRRIKELLVQEYKNGYNQRLKDEGKIGERWQHLYL